MGFNFKDDIQFVHVVLMTPNGRLIAMRPPHHELQKLWQVTVTRPLVVKNFDNEDEGALKAATMGVFTRFAFRPDPDDLSHITCNYALKLNRVMHLYICKIPSGEKLICSGNTQVRVLTLERLCNELYTEPEAFTIETESAINLISGLNTKSKGAP